MADVIVVGSYNQDFVWKVAQLPAPGETQLALFSTGPGGKGFNQAVAARRIGADVLFVGARGNDAAGEQALQTAARFELNAEWQICAGATTGTAAVLVDRASQNLIAVAPGANAQLSPDFIAAHTRQIENARVLLTQCEVQASASVRAMAVARSAGVCTVFNPAPVHLELIDTLLDLTDILTPNESEFSALLSAARHTTALVSSLADLDDASLHSLCRKLHRGTVVLTLGAQGCFVSHPGEQQRGDRDGYYRCAAEAAKAVDSTGAGDAFNGGLVASLATQHERTFVQHIRFAGRVAAMSVERSGAAESMPLRVDFAQRFGEQPD